MAHVAVKEVENPRSPPLVRWKNNKSVAVGLNLTGIWLEFGIWRGKRCKMVDSDWEIYTSPYTYLGNPRQKDILIERHDQ